MPNRVNCQTRFLVKIGSIANKNLTIYKLLIYLDYFCLDV